VRTTVTLDDDLAIRIERLSQESGRSFKSVINEAIRAGLESMQVPEQRRSFDPISYTDPLPGRLLMSIEDAIKADDEYDLKKLA
jgi:hypothetical protein